MIPAPLRKPAKPGAGAAGNALPAHGEPVRLDVDEQHRLSKRVTREEACTNAAGFYALGQVRAGQLDRIFAHFC